MVPQSNGMLPADHVRLREARRRERQADMQLLTNPPAPRPDPLRLYVRVGRIFVLILLVALALALLFGQPRAVRAEPRSATVAIVQVDADEGRYYADLDDGRALILVPVSRRTPALVTGPATLTSDSRWLGQGGATFRALVIVQVAQ